MNKPFQVLEEELRAFDPRVLAEKRKSVSGFSGDVDSGHIFYDLLEFLGEKAEARKLELLYYFHSYQECFLRARSGGLSLAANKRSFIEKNLPLDFDSQTSLALEVIWDPARAFLELAEGRPEAAEASLRRSIAGLRHFEKQGLSQAAGAILEQQLNLCRVHLQTKNMDKAIAACEALMLDVANRIPDDPHPSRTFNYYFDSVLWSSFRLDPVSFNRFLTGLLQAASIAATSCTSAPLALSLLLLAAGDDDSGFLNALCDSFPGFFFLHKASQTTLLAHAIVAAVVQNAPDRFALGDRIATYLKDSLKVEARTLESVLTALFSRKSAILAK